MWKSVHEMCCLHSVFVWQHSLRVCIYVLVFGADNLWDFAESCLSRVTQVENKIITPHNASLTTASMNRRIVGAPEGGFKSTMSNQMNNHITVYFSLCVLSWKHTICKPKKKCHYAQQQIRESAMKMFYPEIHAGHVVLDDWDKLEWGRGKNEIQTSSWRANMQRALKWNEEWKDFGTMADISLTRQELIMQAWWLLIDQLWSDAKDPLHTLPISISMWLQCHSCIPGRLLSLSRGGMCYFDLYLGLRAYFGTVLVILIWCTSW